MAVATSMPIKTEPSSNLSPRKWPSASAAAAAVAAAARISLCVGCGSEIYDQYILRVSPDLEWHASCLKCFDCQQYLDESCTCFVRDGKTYCKRDYLRLFGAKCAKCSMCFSKTDLVMRARNKIYHVECFRCAVCARQLTRGDEFVLKFDDLFCKADHEVSEKTPTSILLAAAASHHHHHHHHLHHLHHTNATQLHPQQQSNNGGLIGVGGLTSSNCSLSSTSTNSSTSSTTSSSSSSLTPLTPVTPDCLKEPSTNHQLLTLGGGGPGQAPPNVGSPSSSTTPTSSSSSSLTVLNSSSNNNNNGLMSNGVVGGVVHGTMGSIPPPPGGPSLNQMPLHPAGIIPGPGGDLNGHMNSSNISPSGGAGAPTHLQSLSAVHMDHHASLTAGASTPINGQPPSNGGNPNGAPSSGGSTGSAATTASSSSTTSSSASSQHGGHHHHHRSSSGHSRSSMSGGHHNSKNPDHKPTRVRTVLNEKQLHTLRSCYNANPRPDALMKEQLVEMTGLSPRVIRVWFQNKRCKDKKRSILMKQIQQQEKDGRQLNIGQMRGVPLIATSPVRHESPIQMNPMDVHSYQPPWKALADYASMQPDIDPNTAQFQHLVSQMHGYTDGINTPNDTSLSSLGHGGPPTGPCTPMSYMADQDIHQPHSNMSSDLSSPCTSE